MSDFCDQRPCCAPLPDGTEMARWDAAAVSEGKVSAVRLMANAGEGALRALKTAWAERRDCLEGARGANDTDASPVDRPVLQGAKILLFMGKGNNGGDAAALARFALREGAEVLLCHLHPLLEDPAGAQDAAGAHLRDALACGVAAFRLSAPGAPLPPGWEQPDIIVDGLLGTGFTPPLRPELAALIKRINALSLKIPSTGDGGATVLAAPTCAEASGGGLSCKAWSLAGKPSARPRPAPLVLALDIPSGLSASGDKPSPLAVSADITVTFEAPKPGLLLPVALPWVGRLLVQPVGIPLGVQAKYPPARYVLLPGCASAGRGPQQTAHKGRAGRVLVIGGSAGLTGAPHLSALGALRGGAGLVRIACPAGLNDQVKYGCPDIMTLPLGKGLPVAPEDWRECMGKELAPHLAGNDAIIIGPGLGLSGGGHAFLLALLTLCGEMEKLPPLLLDADALTILADTPELTTSLPVTSVFTPHPGEAARLLKTSVADVEADRRAALGKLTDLLPGTVLLKGAGTLIGRGKACYFLPFVEPNLAVGGSGDVLAGLIAAYLARGANAPSAACAGAYVHGLCGHMLREVAPERGNLASDIAGTIPRARSLVAKLPSYWLPATAFNPS